MRLSLVIPLYADFDAAARAEGDLQSFFGKFPMDAELIWVVDPRLGAAGKKWVESSVVWPPGFSRRVLVNSRRLGRGRSVQRGLNEATGDLLCVLSADLSVPLAEIFAGLRLMMNEPDPAAAGLGFATPADSRGGSSGFPSGYDVARATDLIVGERNEKKRQGPDLRPRRKAFFDNIESDKAAGLQHPVRSPDPTTPFFMIRASLWKKLSPTLKFRSWYYTPALIAAATDAGAQVISIKVTHSTGVTSHQRWWESLFG